MYWMMECYAPPGNEKARLAAPPTLPVSSWIEGSRFKLPVPVPIQLHWDPAYERFARVSMYDAGIVLMHTRLVEALARLGVDNLDTYGVEITSPTDGSHCRDYLAVNVIGIVAAVDRTASRIVATAGSGPMIDVDFDGVAIDEGRARGLALFRLAECVTALVIRDDVKRGLESMGGFGLTFVPPSEWTG